MPARQRMPRGMVAQHGAVAPERADRMIDIELDKAAVAGCDRAAAQPRGTADDIRGAEMEMDRQPVAQRSLGEPRGADKEVEPLCRRMPLGSENPVSTAGLAAFGEGAGEVDG